MFDDHNGRLPAAILFDVDGCLISTGGAGAAAWRHAFDTLYGVPADIWQFTEAGMTDPEVGRATFVNVMGREPADKELARVLAAYLGRLSIEVEQSTGYRVMPGVEALLPRLVEAGILLGITTGALEAAAHIKLGRAGLNRFFCVGGYGSDTPERAALTRLAIERAGRIHGHTLDPARVLVVGDTPRDVDAAHAAGAVAVGVATGRYSVAELRAAGADHALPTLEEPLPGLPAPARASADARAVLWDMDGTLVDSAALHWQAWQETFAAEGRPVTRDQFEATFGQRNDAVVRGFLGPDLTASQIERIAAAKEARYRDLVRTGGVAPLPGVRRWLERLRAAGWRQAVASSAPRLNLETLLEALDMAQYFDAVVSAEAIERGKPDPQIFLVAAAKLDVPPGRCIVVEDAPAGVEAGRRAGMRTVGVRGSRASLDAGLVVRTLAELPDGAFDALLAAPAAGGSRTAV